MKNRYVNWKGILEVSATIIFYLFMIGFCFAVPWGIGHIPIHSIFFTSDPASAWGYWAHGFFYCLIWTVLLLVLYAIVCGCFMAFGWLFPEKENGIK